MRQMLLKLTMLPIFLAACTLQPTASVSPENTQYTAPTTSVTNPLGSPTPTQQDAQPTPARTPLPATPVKPTPTNPFIPQVIDTTNANSITRTTKIELGPWELVHALDWSPDGTILAIAAGGTITLYSAGDFTQMLTLNPGIWSQDIHFSPDGSLIAAGGRDGTLRIWDTLNGDLVREFEAHKKGVNSVAFSPDGQLLASGGNDAMARLWDVSTGEQWSQMIGGTYAIPAIAFTVDGESLAMANGDIVRIRDVSDQRFVSTLRGEDSFFSLSPSADGRFVAAGDTSGSVFIWDLASEQVANKFSTQPIAAGGNFTLVWEVTFSPDGNLVASASGDGVIHIWDVKTGELLASLNGHRLAVSAISFSPDGFTLASGGLDGEIHIWQVLR